MDQQKMFNQMVPNNYIVCGLKHTRSDRYYLASIPICPWLTQRRFRTSFQREVLLFPGIQKAPANKSCKLWAHLHKLLWNMSEFLKQKIYRYNTKNLWSYNSITAKASHGWNPHAWGKHASYRILWRDTENESLGLVVGKHFFSKQNHGYTDSPIAFSGHIVLHSHLPLHIRHSQHYSCH